MMKTTYSILLSASMVIALLFVEVALASTFKRYNCGCDPTAEDDQICSCSNDYSLAPFPGGTKEFRASCTNPIKHYDICVGGKSSKTTCTSSFYIDYFKSDYVSKSCTNWGKRDYIDVRVVCFGKDSQLDENHPCNSS